MTGILIPHDRTTRQPARGYCTNPQCLERSDASRFEFPADHDRFACPKCGADQGPGVGLLVLTHLLIHDPTGPIIGELGRRYRLACHADRAYLATLTNLEAATGDPRFCTCPGCLAEAEKRQITIPQGNNVEAERPALARITL